MKHKYIFSGLVSGNEKIRDFRLINSITKYSLGQAVRVNLPNDVYLNYCIGDGYTTTTDNRTLDELGWDAIIFYKGKWRKFNALKEFQPCDWFRVLEYIYGLYNCYDDIGWTDSKEYYNKWYKDRMSGVIEFKNEIDLVYPRYTGSQKDLNLEVKLKDTPFNYPNERWFKKYLELKENKKREI